jgi:hypothetical protein
MYLSTDKGIWDIVQYVKVKLTTKNSIKAW